MKRLSFVMCFNIGLLLFNPLPVSATQEEIIQNRNGRIPTLQELTISNLCKELTLEDHLKVIKTVPEASTILIPHLPDKGEELYNYLNTLEAAEYNTPVIQQTIEFIEDHCASLIVEERDESSAEKILNQVSELYKPLTRREVAKNKQALYLKGSPILPKGLFADPTFQTLKVLEQNHSGDSSLYPTRLKSISPSIEQLVFLETIDFRCNFIKIIPRELFNLKNLKSLNLNGNRIEIVPAELNSMISLRSLSLGSNKIKMIFPFINKLTNLEELNLQDNLIETLQDFSKEYNNLKILSLSSNPIEGKPEQAINNLIIPSIRKLFLNNLGLTVIPRAIQNYNQLEGLEISRNNIVLIPEWIKGKKYFNSKDIAS